MRGSYDLIGMSTNSVNSPPIVNRIPPSKGRSETTYLKAVRIKEGSTSSNSALPLARSSSDTLFSSAVPALSSDSITTHPANHHRSDYRRHFTPVSYQRNTALVNNSARSTTSRDESSDSIRSVGRAASDRSSPSTTAAVPSTRRFAGLRGLFRDSDSSLQSMEEISVKVVLVGDAKCGKTSLALRFTYDCFTEVYSPTCFDRYETTHDLGNTRCHLSIWDTAGASNYDGVRPLTYNDANVFILCFQIGDPNSLANVLDKWYGEIRKFASPDVPIILCGCQSDSRNDFDRISNQLIFPVTPEQGLLAMRQIHATTYIETSAKLSHQSCTKVFEMAALSALGKLTKRPQLPARAQSTVRKSTSSYNTSKRKSHSKQDLSSVPEVKPVRKTSDKNCSIM